MSDLIERKAAIERIESEYKKWGEEYDILQVLGDLEDLPSAQPQWIPCSERLPEEEDMYKPPKHRYLCQLRRQDITLVLARLRNVGSPMAAFWDWYGRKVPDKDVIAWMSLPKLYKEQEG